MHPLPPGAAANAVPGDSETFDMNTVSNRPHMLGWRSRIQQRYYSLVHLATGTPSARRYNLSISHKYRFVWFRVAKNGTRTTLASLRGAGIELDVEESYSIRYSLRSYEDYYKFAVVRNPWDRLVSCWLQKVVGKNAFKFDEKMYQEMKTFSSFVDFVSSKDIENCNAHFALQSSLIDLNHLDYLARMETFESDLTAIFGNIGIEPFKLIVTNVTKQRKHYSEYYTESLQKKVQRIYEKDIQLFGYTYR